MVPNNMGRIPGTGPFTHVLCMDPKIQSIKYRNPPYPVYVNRIDATSIIYWEVNVYPGHTMPITDIILIVHMGIPPQIFRCADLDKHLYDILKDTLLSIHFNIAQHMLQMATYQHFYFGHFFIDRALSMNAWDVTIIQDVSVQDHFLVFKCSPRHPGTYSRCSRASITQHNMYGQNKDNAQWYLWSTCKHIIQNDNFELISKFVF